MEDALQKLHIIIQKILTMVRLATGEFEFATEENKICYIQNSFYIMYGKNIFYIKLHH